MSYLIQLGPTSEPLSLPDAKAHLRVVTDDDDTVIQAAIRSARWNLERKYRRCFLTQTLVLGLDFFGMPDRSRDALWPISWWPPNGFQYPTNQIIDLRPPVQSVTSVQYTDPSGNVQTLAPSVYGVDTDSEPGRLYPALGQIWPAIATVPNAVRITFVAGYTDARNIPDDMLQALKLTIGDIYENREQTLVGSRLIVIELPRGVDALMKPYQKFLVR